MEEKKAISRVSMKNSIMANQNTPFRAAFLTDKIQT